MSTTLDQLFAQALKIMVIGGLKKLMWRCFYLGGCVQLNFSGPVVEVTILHFFALRGRPLIFKHA